MAKNKNTRKPAQRAARSDRPQQRSDEAVPQHQPTIAQVQGSPADVARKQRRFGHN
ncbi:MULTISPECIES: hypothetical protein [Streptomyces]|uniref:Small hydrophilic protein n=1 Tax=Streptomyces chilikensis TaxID=1194079 RepID=A0ABV3ENC0_9ACTN|nr:MULTISPECIES: hypothetical protein [Streptomyces]MDH6227429.1 hypothetical protein [Streptomyces sp. MJP52]